MIKRLVKSVFAAIAPNQFNAFVSGRADRHGQRLMERAGLPQIAADLIARYGLKVLDGPFKGMEYIQQSSGSTYVPKLIGSYECELHAVISRTLTVPYDVVADVGCAEGYYAVGFAMRLPAAEVFAYDTNPRARNLCSELARINGVAGRVHIEGFCDTTRLQTVLRGRSLVICDCEGYEASLLQPSQAPALTQANILVELHEWLCPGITASLVERFAATHDIELIDTARRDPANYPALGFLGTEQQQAAIAEGRPHEQQWAVMTSKPDAKPGI